MELSTHHPGAGNGQDRMTKRVLTTLVAVLLADCALTADLTRSQSSTCEVHRCTMTIQVVDCVPGGFSGYRPDFDWAWRKQFPHHGRIHFSEDHGYMYARHLRTYVCPECTRAHDQWLTEHP